MHNYSSGEYVALGLYTVRYTLPPSSTVWDLFSRQYLFWDNWALNKFNQIN